VSPFVALPFVALPALPQLMPSMAAWWGLWFELSVFAVGGALACVFLLTLILLLVRFQWLAMPLFIGIMSLATGLSGATLSAVFLFCVIWYAVTRFGLISASALLYVYNIGGLFPPALINPSVWYADSALLAVLSVLTLAVYAFYTTLAGRTLWRDTGE
jgi:hypothetical protein